MESGDTLTSKIALGIQAAGIVTAVVAFILTFVNIKTDYTITSISIFTCTKVTTLIFLIKYFTILQLKNIYLGVGANSMYIALVDPSCTFIDVEAFKAIT